MNSEANGFLVTLKEDPYLSSYAYTQWVLHMLKIRSIMGRDVRIGKKIV